MNYLEETDSSFICWKIPDGERRKAEVDYFEGSRRKEGKKVGGRGWRGRKIKTTDELNVVIYLPIRRTGLVLLMNRMFNDVFNDRFNISFKIYWREFESGRVTMAIPVNLLITALERTKRKLVLRKMK